MFYAQQCLKYQQNEQLLLTSNHRTQEKRTRYADDKSGPGLGQVQTWGGDIQVI